MRRDRLIEALEMRRMLAVFGGTDSPDNVIITFSGGLTHVNINGTDHATSNTSNTINLLGGDDVVQVGSTGAGTSITVDAGAGDDLILNSLHDLDAVFAGNFSFIGGDGNDFVQADNSADSTGAVTIDLQGNGIFKDLSALLSFSAVENLRFDDSNGSDRIDFLNLQNGIGTDVAHATINGNGGNDLIINHRTATTGGYLPTSMGTGGMTVNGGEGVDTVSLDDSTNNLPATYDITSTTLAYDGALYNDGVLNYNACESFELTGTVSNDLVTLGGEPAGMSMVVQTNDGNDRVICGGGDLDTNGFDSLTVRGGAGSDSIQFDDHLDRYSVSEDELVQLNGTELDKGAVAVQYSEFESMEFDASSTINGPLDFNPPEVVNLNTTNGIPTTIFACFNRLTTVNISNPNPIAGNLSLIDAPVTVTMGGAGGMAVNDQTSTGNTGYTITSTQVTTSTGKTINYSGSGVTLNANGGLNFISVKSSSNVEPIVINGGNGDDTVVAGNGNLDANLHRNVIVNGGAGSDLLELDNTADNTLESQTLNSGSFVDGQTITFSVDNLEISEGPGGETLGVTGVANYTLLVGNSGPDTVNVGTGNLDTTLGADMVIQGNGGNDVVTLDDHSTTAADAYNFDGSGFYKNTTGHHVATSDNVTRLVLQANGGSNTINVNQSGTPLSIFGNAGNDGLNVTRGLFGGPDVTFDGGTGLDGINNALGTFGAAKVTLAANIQDLSFVDVGAGATVVIPSQSVADIQFSMSLTGVIDMAGGALILRGGASQLSTFSTQIKNGYANGAWNGTTGPSINSSLAASSSLVDLVGFASASSVFSTFPANFVGTSVNANDMLVRYTLAGDANLDGSVNVADLGILATNWQGTNKTFSQGDFDYDNKVDVADLGLLATNWQQSVSPSSPVPAAINKASKQQHEVSESVLEEQIQ